MQMAAFLRAALLLGCVVAAFGAQAKESPLQKVVSLLKVMRETGLKDKAREAEEWEAYKKFCQGSSDSVASSIAEQQQTISILEADIVSAQTSALMNQKEIEVLENEIAAAAESKAALAVPRNNSKDSFDKAYKAYTDVINAINTAIDILKTQANKVSPQAVALLSKVEHAEVAQAQAALMTFLASYDSESALLGDEQTPSRLQPIIELLEKLRDKFVDERTKKESEEQAASQGYSGEIQALNDAAEAKEAQKSAKAQAKAADLETASGKKANLEDATKTLTDLQKQLTETKSLCDIKESDFEARQRVRDAELAAIDQAISILSGVNEKAASAALLQKVATALASLRSTIVSPSQLQVAKFLREEAAKLNSRVLSVMAVQATQNPFGDVRKKIQELIATLESEEKQEAEHELFCAAELNTNEESRTSRAAAVARLQSEIDQSGSHVAKLADEIAELASQVKQSEQDLLDLAAIREKEKEANQLAAKDAKEAQAAINQAILILKQFYQGGSASLVQVGDPKKPFEGAYTGMTDSGIQVITLLEEILATFARDEAQAIAAEASAQSAFTRQVELMTTTKSQLESDKAHKEHDKTAEEQELANLNKDLSSANAELQTAQAYYEKLKPSCLEGGSAEERKQRRREEIDVLKLADKILAGEIAPDAAAAAPAAA